MSTAKTIQDLTSQDYKWGFVTTIEEDRIPKGLNEETIRLISAKKGEPEFMLESRLKAYRHWTSLEKAQADLQKVLSVQQEAVAVLDGLLN